MGQYYHVITEDKNGNREYFNIQNQKWLESKLSGSPDYTYYNGLKLMEHRLKLMEHSWIGNDFCEALAARLVDNPKRVCWVGDYAESEECEELGFTCEEVWERSKDDYIFVDETDFKMMKDVKYLVNNTKNIYVDLTEYFKSSNRPEEWNGKMEDWCIFPISLLTALGNDRGGGDFHEGNTGYETVGTWAFDEIYLTNNLPDGYEKVNVVFIEE